MIGKKDYYSTLEVNPRASQEVIDAAYRILMKKYHPDVSKVDRSKELNVAHETLSDISKRKEYDKERLDRDKMVGPYKLQKLIAEGGFGRTYIARHTILDELVCIKDCLNVSAQDTDILIQEAKATWDLRHYAIPAMRDLIRTDDGRVLLVMSYVPGLTLEQIVDKVGPLDAETVCWITGRILNAFDYIHRHGVIHGDFKPQNVIVQDDKHMAVIVDFGLSLVKPTSTTISKGYTPHFAPPEEVDGRVLLPESDYYSLGMTMIYALGGGMQFVEKKIVPKSVPDELCSFIVKLIVKDLKNRPQYGKDDLCDMLTRIREKCFGRGRSGMKPIAGLK